jgi:hypothetical protein
MLATYVEARKTPLAYDDALLAMRAALRYPDGSYPPNAAIALALAKTALETGRWQAIWNSNWGNIKCPADQSGMFCCITLNEVIKGKVVWFAPHGQLVGGPGSGVTGSFWDVPDGHPQTRMRAYANRFDGAFEYVDFLAKRTRYAKAWARLLTGDPVAFVHELKVAGYFTADEATYAATVVKLHREFLGKLQGRHVDPVELPDHEWENLRAIVMGSRNVYDQKAIDAVRAEGMAELGMDSTRNPGDPEA